MFNNILGDINLIDVLLVCIFLRILYIGLQKGPLVEIFKLLGTFVATFICLHYYVRLARISYNIVAIPRWANNILAFFLLWLITTMVFRFLREGFLLLRGQREDKPATYTWLSFPIATIRGILVCGLFFLVILLTDQKTLVNMAYRSHSFFVGNTSIEIYRSIYKGVIENIFPGEEFNDQVLSLQDPGRLI